jgi:hypothetical protein
MTHHRAGGRRPRNQKLNGRLVHGGVLATDPHRQLEVAMAEVLVEFTDPVTDSEGNAYTARACGSEMDDGRWQGWIEFVPLDDSNPFRTGRETTQPNRTDALYWATGLTQVYLQGALERALRPLVRPAARRIAPPAFDEPARDIVAPPAAESILNPFSVYRKGEDLLRRQLGAFSVWHLVNIIRAHDLSGLPADELNKLNGAELVELIVATVRTRAEEPISG